MNSAYDLGRCETSRSSQFEESFPREECYGFYARPRIDTKANAGVGQEGGVLLTGTVSASGLDVALRGVQSRWRSPFAVHDPAEIHSGIESLDQARHGPRRVRLDHPLQDTPRALHLGQASSFTYEKTTGTATQEVAA